MNSDSVTARSAQTSSVTLLGHKAWRKLLLKTLKRYGAWSGLALPRFKCGHEKTERNSYTAGKYPRCKTCHDRKRK